MYLRRSIASVVLIAIVAISCTAQAWADGNWIDLTAGTHMAPPPQQENWIDAFPHLRSVAADPRSGRLVAVGDDGTLLVSGTDPTQPWTTVTSNTNSDLGVVVLEPKSGRLVAVGENGTVMVSGADPTQPWTNVTSNTPNNLNTVAVDPRTGRLIAAGDSGTVVVSGADPAQPWTNVTSNTFSNLFAVGVEPKSGRVVAVGQAGTVVVSGADPTQPWTMVNSDTANSLGAVAVEPRSGRLVAVGDNGTVEVSGADPTQPWTNVTSTTKSWLSAIMLEPKSGRLVAVGGNGTVVASGTNPTQPWNVVAHNTVIGLRAVTVEPTSGRMIVVGDNGTVMVSGADPTRPWTRATSNTTDGLSAVAVTPKGGRLVAVGYSGTVMVSGADPTQPWTRVTSNPSTDLFAVAVAPKSGRLVAVGDGGTVLASGADPTQPWTKVTSNSAEVLHNIAVQPTSGRLVAVGDSGLVMVSGADPTQPWTRVTSNTVGDLYGVAVEPKSGRVVAVGWGDTVVVSGADPTQPWTNVSGNAHIGLVAVAAEPKSGRVVAVGQAGTVMVSGADPTQPWTNVTSNTNNGLVAVATEPKSGRLVAVGYNGAVVVSGADPTQPWTNVISNTNSNLNAVAVDPRSGRMIAVGQYGTVVVSGADPIGPWTNITSNTLGNLSAVAVDPKRGRLIAGGDGIIESLDGGLSWGIDKLSSQAGISALAVDRSSRVVALGAQGAIFVEKPESRKQAASPIQIRFDGPLKASGSSGNRISALIAWRYRPGAKITCNTVTYSMDEPDQAQLPGLWAFIGVTPTRDANGSAPGFSAVWEPPAFVGAATIYYALWCSDLTLGDTWIQTLPVAQHWTTAPVKTVMQQGMDWLGQLSSAQLVGLAAAICGVLWVMLLFFIYWRAPIWILAWHERIPEPSAIDDAASLLDKAGFTAFSLLALAIRLPLLFLGTSPRALDAWLAERAEDARAAFIARSTVFDRRVTLDLPVMFGETRYDEPWAPLRRMVSATAPFVLLVSGPGGAGKTTLACRIGRRVLGTANDPPLGRFRSLPLLLEANLPDEATTPDGLVPYLAGVIRVAANADRRITIRLAAALLGSGRVLVIVDGLSERADATVQAFNPQRQGFPINRLVVTSRDGAPPGISASLRIETIPAGALFDFIERYLVASEETGQGKCPPKEDIHRACADLTRLLGETPCTPLLASMWAREVGSPAAQGKPRGVASLMDSYVRGVLRPAAQGNEALVDRLTQDAKRIAERELGERYQPGFITREAALAVLRGLDAQDPEVRIGLLEKSRLLDSPSPDSDVVRIGPDPVAEHLVGRLKVETLAADEPAWRDFMTTLDNCGWPEGFVEALCACIDHEAYGGLVPTAVRMIIKSRRAAP